MAALGIDEALFAWAVLALVPERFELLCDGQIFVRFRAFAGGNDRGVLHLMTGFRNASAESVPQSRRAPAA